MGLKEKRVAREFQENRLESLTKQIFKAAQFEFELDINWETISVDNYSHLYDECWPKVYFEPLTKAFKELCDDKFSQEAISGDLTKVVIQNYGNVHSANNFASYMNGVLTLNHSPVTNIDHINDRKENIKKVIEDAL